MIHVLLIALLAVVPAPRAHAAATCADFVDQADAQRAANTRDGDGDGLYCEDLPCPCLGPGHGGGSGKPAPHRKRLGPGVYLGPVTKRSGCRVHGGLPDRACTPGVYYSRVTKRDVCTPGYSARVRDVPQSRKDAVYAKYGIYRAFDGSDGEVDHLVPLELGGTNATANLFPEPASPTPGSHEKDQLENALHDEVCAGQITLRRAQRLIATDWVAAYRARLK